MSPPELCQPTGQMRLAAAGRTVERHGAVLAPLPVEAGAKYLDGQLVFRAGEKRIGCQFASREAAILGCGINQRNRDDAVNHGGSVRAKKWPLKGRQKEAELYLVWP